MNYIFAKSLAISPIRINVKYHPICKFRMIKKYLSMINLNNWRFASYLTLIVIINLKLNQKSFGLI